MFRSHVHWFLALSVATGGAGLAQAAEGLIPVDLSVTGSVPRIVTLGLILLAEDNPPQNDPREQDAKEILKLNQAFQKAYNEGDAQAVANLFVENGEVVNDEGLSVQGRSEIAEHFKRAFEASPGEKIELVQEHLSFLGPDLAREMGLAVTKPSDGGPSETSRYRAILTRVDGRWLQATVQEYAGPEPSAHDRLEELAWLIGDWVDESEDAVVDTHCDWSDDGSYLVREFVIEVGGQPLLSGTQRIGWDPRLQRFHSWIFDPDGGHSEGLWTRIGPRDWRIQARGVLADGTEVSATQSISSDHKDRLQWRSYDRSIGGESLPDQPEIVLVRKPPAPASTDQLSR
ncbi:MAG TPA: SgcJ/EcaC family oxidoreductase [Isosphaeraceae bacterium]|nr:SgcJ/EcaC family oxidoreductase [Isosphaeraceae bacterium]